MGIRQNIASNYISQGFTAIVGIVMVPIYLRHMGAEAYGLVGFFTLLQGWFQLLDVGLTPTIMREIARFRGGATDADTLRKLVRTLEGIFFGIALLGALLLIAGSGPISSRWLRVQQLPLSEVRACVAIMGAMIAVRLVSSLYRGAISGFEQMVWLGAFNVSISIIKSILVVPFLIFISKQPAAFFLYQFVVSLLEMGILAAATYRLLPKLPPGTHLSWDWKPIRVVLKFSMGIALTGSLWVLVTQTGTLVLSRLLPLKDFGYFSMAVLAANGVMILSGPITVAILPRLTKLVAEGNDAGFLDLYRNATQLVSIITLPTALMLLCFAKPALWVWTGNPEIAAKAGPILALYALGNGLLSLGTFPYFLQYAKGNLKLHVIGSILYFLLYIPTLILATLKFGSIGAAASWVAINLLYVTTWLPFVHSHFIPKLNKNWYRDVAQTLLPTTILATLFHNWHHATLHTRLLEGMTLTGLGMMMILATALCSRLVWSRITKRPGKDKLA